MAYMGWITEKVKYKFCIFHGNLGREILAD